MPRTGKRHFPNVKVPKTPSLRRHRPSGRAVVTLNGQDVYCGPWGTREAVEEFDRVTAAWIANGRRLPSDAEDLRVGELAEMYMRYATTYYRRPDGTPTGEVHAVRSAVVALGEKFRRERVREFGPLKLEAFQAFLVTKDWARTTINMAVGRVRRMFKWAVAKQLIAADVLHALQAVAPLKRGRTTAREPKPIRPVALDIVAATLPHLPTPVRAMVQTQLASGMRPGEVCTIRTQDVDRSVWPWKFVPERHKTEIHGKARAIFIGPEAQAALAPFLRDDEPWAYVFQPADSMKELHEERTAARKTPLHYGNRPGTNRKRKPKRTPTPRYLPTAYARCIARACKANKIQHWHPNQLRHTAGTRIRAMFGVEGAATVLGHSNLETTQIYAEVNERRAAEIALQVG